MIQQVEQVVDKHQQVIDLVKGRCLEVSFTIHNLPKSRRITGKKADEIAKTVKGSKKGISSSWRIFCSEHPAVQQLNQAIRDLASLRDSWTLVRCAESTNSEDKTIEGGVRLIWDQDIPEFYKQFTLRAQIVDKAAQLVQKCLDQPYTFVVNNREQLIPSIKEMDKKYAGEAWDESAYPKDVCAVVGVPKERDSDGNVLLDENGVPKYIINFEEYRVSEKLPEVLRKRAVELLESRLSETVDTAFSYALREMNNELQVLIGELVDRVRLYPSEGHPLHKYYTENQYGPEVVRVVTHKQDSSIGEDEVKILLSYKQKNEDKLVTVREWVGPIPYSVYESARPTHTGERKKIYPAVIESVIEKLLNFRERKAKMLGEYGKEASAAFDDLLRDLTRMRRLGESTAELSQRLADQLRKDQYDREMLAEKIGDTIAALESQAEEVSKTARRRKLMLS